MTDASFFPQEGMNSSQDLGRMGVTPATGDESFPYVVVFWREAFVSQS